MEAPDIEGLDALVSSDYFLTRRIGLDSYPAKSERVWFINERRWNFYVFHYCF
jgi:DUF1365 family protein